MRRALHILLALALTLTASSAAADREHRVRAGQNLSRIARRYGVAVATLAAANRLRPDSALREGQVLRVPDEGIVVVGEGHTLSLIARRNGVTVEALARANGIRETAALRVGQELLLPGASPSREPSESERTWGRPRTPGVVTIARVSTHQRLRLRLVDARRTPRRAAITQLSQLMRPDGMRRPPRLQARLLALLADVSDHFGGRTIHLVSGFRTASGYTQETSRHTQGRAIDFRVEGVPNTVLRDYVRRFRDVGCGYYPRSTFVHMDVRDRATYWVDWSRPGQAPVYRREGEGPPPEPDEVGEGSLEERELALQGAEAHVIGTVTTQASEPKPPAE